MKLGGTRLRGAGPFWPCGRLDPSARVGVPHGRATNSMSAEVAQEFVDTNVLVYAFDASARAKQTGAQQLLERLWDAGTGCVSVQVLQEFFVTTTRKVARPLPVDETTERIREFATWKVS